MSADGQQRTFRITGQLFFASVQGVLAAFDFRESVERAVLALSAAHRWDGSAVAALDRAVAKFHANGVAVQFAGLNEASAKLAERLGSRPGGIADGAVTHRGAVS